MQEIPQRLFNMCFDSYEYIDGKYNFTGVFSSLSTAKIPFSYSFYIATLWRGQFNKMFTYDLKIADIHGRTIAMIDNNLMSFGERIQTKWSFNGFKGCIFPAYGEYHIITIANGIDIGMEPLFILKE